jgi:hypothetical protein
LNRTAQVQWREIFILQDKLRLGRIRLVIDALVHILRKLSSIRFPGATWGSALDFKIQIMNH